MSKLSDTRILCFGDSNTWGYIPGSGKRYSKDIRWSGCLARILKERNQAITVIEDGVNGRTSQHPNLLRRRTNGATSLPRTLSKHSPDITILALGINDLKRSYSSSAAKTAAGISRLVDMVRMHKVNSAIIITSPTEIPERFCIGDFRDSARESRLLSKAITKVAAEKKTLHLSANKLISPSELDGIHYDPEAHQVLAKHLAKMILAII